MKKYLFVLAAALVALAGCKPTGGSEYTKISFKDANLDLAIGEQKKLNVLWEPTSITTAPTCTWTSSNEEVVAVDQNGNVEALAEGQATVTAKCGELTAVCQINVKTIYDLLTWNMVLMSVDETDPETAIGEPYEVGNNTKYTVQKFWGEFVLCGEGLEYTQGVGISGAGFISYVECPIEVIIEGQYAGYVWTDMILFSNDSPADSAGVCAEGALTDANEWYQYITDSTYTGDGSFKGAAVHYIDYDNQRSYGYLGFIKNGVLQDYYSQETGEQVYYMLNITWFDNMNGVYGLLYDEEADGFVTPPTFTDRDTKYYENLPEQDVKAKTIPTLKKVNNLNKMQFRNVKDAKVFMHK